MKKIIAFLLIFIPVITFGQFEYMDQTKKYIIDEFSNCNISLYTDTSVCIKCNSPFEDCYYFNKDGVCYFIVWEYNEEDARKLFVKLYSDGYTKVADFDNKNGNGIKIIKSLCKSTLCVEISKFSNEKSGVFYWFYFYKFNVSTLKCDN